MSLSAEQFNKLATKDDLKNFVTKDELNVFKNEFHDVMDVIIKKLDNMEHAFISNQVAHDRFETRITKIEKQKIC